MVAYYLLALVVQHLLGFWLFLVGYLKTVTAVTLSEDLREKTFDHHISSDVF